VVCDDVKADGTAEVCDLLEHGERLLTECVAAARLAGNDKHASTITTHCNMLLDFLGRHVESQNLQAAVAAHLSQLRATLTLKTIHNHKWSISTLMEHAVEQGVIGQNPCRKITVKRPPRNKPKYLTSHEIAQTIAMADELGCGPEVRVALTTGLRLGEMQRLKWVDVHFDTMLMDVRPGKTGQPRTVPLCVDALAALRAQRQIVPEDLPWVFPGRQTWRGGGMRYVDRIRGDDWWHDVVTPIQQAIPKFLQDAGPHATGRFWHTLRHTFASVGVQRGATLYQIGGFLGHENPQTTTMYAHLAVGYDPIIERVNPLAAASPATEAIDLDPEIARAIIADLQAVIEQAGLEDRIPASTRAMIKRAL